MLGEEDETKEKTEEKSETYTTGRKRKYATVEDIEAISKAIEGLSNQITEVSGVAERLNAVEENQGKIVKALSNRPQGGAPGQGTGNPVADAVLGRVLQGPPSFMEKLAQRSLIEDMMFGRAIRKSVMSKLGTTIASDFAKDVKDALKVVGLEEKAGESEGTEGS